MELSMCFFSKHFYVMTAFDYLKVIEYHPNFLVVASSLNISKYF